MNYKQHFISCYYNDKLDYVEKLSTYINDLLLGEMYVKVISDNLDISKLLLALQKLNPDIEQYQKRGMLKCSSKTNEISLKDDFCFLNLLNDGEEDLQNTVLCIDFHYVFKQCYTYSVYVCHKQFFKCITKHLDYVLMLYSVENLPPHFLHQTLEMFPRILIDGIKHSNPAFLPPAKLEVKASKTLFLNKINKLSGTQNILNTQPDFSFDNIEKNILQLATELAPNPLLVSKDGIIVFVNNEVLKLLETNDSNDLLGHEIINFIHEDFTTLYNERSKIIVLADDTSRVKYRIKTIKGNFLYINVLSRLLVNCGQKFIISVLHNITNEVHTQIRLKESEIMHKSMLELLPEMILIHQNDKIVYVNEATISTSGYSRDELLNQSLFDLVTDNYKTEFYQNNQATESGANFMNMELELLNKSGAVLHVLLKASVIQFLGTKALLFVISNISDRVKIERKLVDTNHAKDRFFSILAHDLRTPMQSLMSSGGLFREYLKKNDTIKLNKHAEVIIQTTDNLSALLDNLLTWSRTQTGTIPIIPEEIDVNVLIECSISSIKGVALNKNIILHNNSIVGQHIFADYNMMYTVMRNLLTNAIKFSYSDSEIHINVRQSESLCEISVIDFGTGIPTEQIQKLFMIGEKFATKGTNDEIGTGLGLVLCKEFVEKNGGNIQCVSNQGKGTTMQIIMPCNCSNALSNSILMN